MPRKSDKPLEKTMIRLFEGDKAVLERFYPVIGYTAVVRQLTHNHVKKLLERESREGVNQHVQLTDDELEQLLDSAEPDAIG